MLIYQIWKINNVYNNMINYYLKADKLITNIMKKQPIKLMKQIYKLNNMWHPGVLAKKLKNSLIILVRKNKKKKLMMKQLFKLNMF